MNDKLTPLETLKDNVLNEIERVAHDPADDQVARDFVHDAFFDYEKVLPKPCEPYRLELTCPKCDSQVTIKMHSNEDSVRWTVMKAKDEEMLVVTVEGVEIYRAVIRAGIEK